MTEAWLPFLLLGLGGSVHCAGMCGGFAALVSEGARRDATSAWRAQVFYVLGKACTYVVLGVALAVAADAALRGGAQLVDATDAHRDHVLERWRGAAAWVAGGVMVALGLAVLGLRPPRRVAQSRFVRGVVDRIRGLFRGVAALPGAAGAFGVGVVTGFLPCGLSWGAFALAAVQPPPAAALGMLVFGLSTGPALALVGLGWSGLGGKWRHLAARAAGPALILFGLLTILRGGVPDSISAAETALPDCCVTDSQHR